MTPIRVLRSNVTREEALRQFSGGLSGHLRSLRSGPLRSVADFYIPFRVFEVEINNAGKKDRRILGLDSVTGSLDPYYFENLPSRAEVEELETRNHVTPKLGPAQARQIVTTKIQRLLFTRGFFRIRNLAISINPAPQEIHIPYWVGFRGRSIYASFEVIDAVRRQPEGARVRRMLQDWLATPSNPTPNVVFPSVSL
jgi:hypothetical protein